jgi:hypothetical protein
MKTLQELKDNCYENIKISFNSEGKIMTRQELKPKIKQLVLSKINFSLELIKNDIQNLNYLKLCEMRDLLINEK